MAMDRSTKDSLFKILSVFREGNKILSNLRIHSIRRALFKNAQFYQNANTDSLLNTKYFESIFGELKNKKIGFVRLSGNVGDRLIDDAAQQLFLLFDVKFYEVNSIKYPELLDELVCENVDEFVVSGGGNMGNIYPENLAIRKQVLHFNKPVTVLPQSFYNSREDLKYKKVYVRDKESLQFREDAILAPDLALGFSYCGQLAKPKYDLGVWLREDKEKSVIAGIETQGDPALISRTSMEYIQLASLYKKIVTNRLHFAISGLIAGRTVYLLPNSYFKNRAMYETWLKDLGCKWLNSVDEFF